MSQFLSAIVTIAKHPKVLCLDLKSHDRTIELLKRKEGTYHEFEWSRDDDGDSLDVRCFPDEDRNNFKAAILAKFPNRRACLVECLRQMAESGRKLDYDMSGCDLKGITLPTSIGGYLDLRGCKNVASIKDQIKEKWTVYR